MAKPFLISKIRMNYGVLQLWPFYFEIYNSYSVIVFPTSTHFSKHVDFFDGLLAIFWPLIFIHAVNDHQLAKMLLQEKAFPRGQIGSSNKTAGEKAKRKHEDKKKEKDLLRN